MTINEVNNRLANGQNCCQIVIDSFCNELKLTKQDSIKLGSCFGGGLGMGENCGALVGAYIALGLKFGGEDSQNINEKRAELYQKFTEKHGSSICKNILSADLSTEQGRALIAKEQLTAKICPQLIANTVNILSEMM